MSIADDYISHPDDPALKVRHLDTLTQMSSARKHHVYGLLRVRHGQRVLDVGCGTGGDTLPLAHLVGPHGRISGVDIDPASVDEANRRAGAAGVQAWVEHRVADATALPFADDTFDACHSERVFMHLPNPAQVFAQMVRVTRPGGWIAVIDPDGASISIDTPEADIERRIAPMFLDKHTNSLAGRQLYRTFKQHGMLDVAVEPVVVPMLDLATCSYLLKLDDLQERAVRAGAVTHGEVDRFRASLERATTMGSFFSSFTFVTVVGRKP